MSPTPVDDGLDEEGPSPSPPVRRASSPAPKGAAASQEVSLPDETLRGEVPIIRARVVYLGPGEHHAISFTGQIHETWVEDPDSPITRKDRQGKLRHYTVIKKATPTGTSQYDFSCRDQRGHLIPIRLMPDTPDIPARLRGRPFAWCEHVGHLRKFYLAEDERHQKLYHLRILPEHVALLREHIRVSERSRRAQEQLFAEVVKG
jgi:hypothetical protein